MGRGFNDDILTLGVLAVGGYLIYTKTDWFQQMFAAIKDIAGSAKGGLKGGGGGAPAAGDGGGGSVGQGNLAAGEAGLIFPGTGKKWQAKDSGKTTRNYASGGSSGTTQWDIKGVGPITDLEVTCFLNVGSCGDEFSIKVYGPDHSDGNCCWFIMDVDCKTGKFMMGGEGPHPSTTKDGLGTGGSIGSMQNKEVGIKLAIGKSGGGYTAIGYAYQGGSWKEMMRKSFAQFGNSKKSSTPSGNANIQFRTDCNGVKYRIAEAAEIRFGGGGGAGAGAAAPAAEATPEPTETKNNKKSSSKYTYSPGQYTTSLFTYNRPLPLGYYRVRN